MARAGIDAWERERTAGGLDAIAINASGCGTTVKDYGFMLRDDPAYADKAARIAALARDVTEIVESLGLRPPARQFAGPSRRVAYHSACSMQHGQRLHGGPKALLAQAGFEVARRAGGASVLRFGRHLQSAAAGNRRQVARAQARQYRRTRPDLVATGNIGCITQLAAGSPVPVVHTVELLDWATGGPEPAALRRAGSRSTSAGGGGRRPGSAKTAPARAAPISVGISQPAPPSISRSPAAPKST